MCDFMTCKTIESNKAAHYFYDKFDIITQRKLNFKNIHQMMIIMENPTILGVCGPFCCNLLLLLCQTLPTCL